MDKEIEEVKKEFNGKERKEDEKKEMAVAWVEVPPTATPSKKKKNRSVKRSPRPTARNQARLLGFHQECEEQRGLPHRRLQEEIRREERTLSPASSHGLKPARPRTGEVVGKDLRKEF